MNSQPAKIDQSHRPDRVSARALPRLLLAWLLTVSLLPYAWGKAWRWYLLFEGIDRRSVVLTAATMTAIAGLAWGLGRGTWRSAWRLRGFWVTLAAWCLVNVLMGAWMVGPLSSPWIVIPPFVIGGLWIPWLAWMWLWPRTAVTSMGVLAILLGLGLGCLGTLQVQGLSGSGQVNVGWRWGHAPRRPEPTSVPPAGTSAEPIAALNSDPAIDYPQFLGPERRGVVPHVSWSDDWQHAPPRRVWQRDLGAGWGAFAVVGPLCFTQEQQGDDECVMAYRLSSGQSVWRHADRASFQSTGGRGPRATPTVADGRVYAVGATGLLNCLDAVSGRRLWAVNILEDNGVGNFTHGVSGSPLVLDGRVIVNPSGIGGPALAAYDAVSGKRLWQAGTSPSSYSSPMVATLEHVRQVLLFGADGLSAHDPADGHILWSFPWANSEHIHCAQPIPVALAAPPGEAVLLSCGYGKGTVLVGVHRAESGAWTTKTLWESRQLRSKFSTPLVIDGRVVGLDEGRLTCLDLQTGERLWKGPTYQYGQLLLAGTRIVVLTEKGEVVLVDPAREGPRELGRYPALDGRTWNNPALSGRHLLVRNDQQATCLELPEKKDAGN